MAELDEAYANADFIPDGALYPDRWAAEAKAFVAELNKAGRARLGLAYGGSPRQAFDLFLPDGAAKGVSIFVHGGYWLRFDRSYWSHFAAGILARGWAVAMPSYDLAPDVRIADITRQIARAVVAIAGEVDGPISLSGHSAGGHLVARMLAPGMLPVAVASRIAHVVPISPVADLRPLFGTSMNEAFQMDEADALAESAVVQPAPSVPVTVWVGGAERPVFLDQATWLAQAWGCGHVVAKDRHHFDVIDALKDNESEMVRRLAP